MAFRLDSRWVLGVGYGFEHETYGYVYHQGHDSATTAIPAFPGPLWENTKGMVGMVDVRLGDNWGAHLVGGSTGFGASITYRF